jgi:hypothetical protein
MKTFLVKYRDFKIYVKANNIGGRMTPLAFDIFYKNKMINGTIDQKHITSIEKAIDSFFIELSKENYEN